MQPGLLIKWSLVNGKLGGYCTASFVSCVPHLTKLCFKFNQQCRAVVCTCGMTFWETRGPQSSVFQPGFRGTSGFREWLPGVWLKQTEICLGRNSQPQFNAVVAIQTLGSLHRVPWGKQTFAEVPRQQKDWKTLPQSVALALLEWHALFSVQNFYSFFIG